MRKEGRDNLIKLEHYQWNMLRNSDHHQFKDPDTRKRYFKKSMRQAITTKMYIDGKDPENHRLYTLMMDYE
jgi:hypothetical protein